MQLIEYVYQLSLHRWQVDCEPPLTILTQHCVRALTLLSLE
jgi:hypothetical protein